MHGAPRLKPSPSHRAGRDGPLPLPRSGRGAKRFLPFVAVALPTAQQTTRPAPPEHKNVVHSPHILSPLGFGAAMCMMARHSRETPGMAPAAIPRRGGGHVPGSTDL